MPFNTFKSELCISNRLNTLYNQCKYLPSSTNKYNKDRISSFPYILYPDVSSHNLAQLKVSWSVLVFLDVVNRNNFSFSILKKQMFIKL